jgi:hypothetical protein
MTSATVLREQHHEQTEAAMARIIKLLRVELEATLEAAKRIEALVQRLRVKRAGQ